MRRFCGYKKTTFCAFGKWSCVSHQSLVDIQHAFDLVFEEPGGAVIFRGGFDGVQKLWVVGFRFGDHAVDLVAAEAPGHSGQVVTAVQAFDKCGLWIREDCGVSRIRHQ